MAVDIYTQIIHRTTQITTNVKECGPCPVFASFTLSFALQLRKKHGKTSVRVRKTSVRLRKTSVRVQYQDIHALQNPHKHTHYKTQTYILQNTNIHITKHKHTHYKTQTYILQNTNIHITKHKHTHYKTI